MRTEIACLTRTVNLGDLRDWLEWHIGRCKFTHVHIFDNESVAGTEELCRSYANVSYEKIEGRPDQYGIYNRYADSRQGKTDWIAFLDDDEFFWFNPGKYMSVAGVISQFSGTYPYAHMLAVRWKFMWPKDWTARRNGPMLGHCTEAYDDDMMHAIGLFHESRMCKPLIKLDGHIYFQNGDENPNGGHIPRHSMGSTAYLISGIPVFGRNTLFKRTGTMKDDDVRILHCKFTGLDEFRRKNHSSIAVNADRMIKCTDSALLYYMCRSGLISDVASYLAGVTAEPDTK